MIDLFSQGPIALTLKDLPTLNALLNATATLMLLVGYYLIKRGHEQAHKRTMIAALVVSAMFLTSYLTYHFQAGRTDFVGPSAIRAIYLSILFPHIVLAVTVPPLALTTIYFGLTDQRARHRRLARWTFPIWLFVSVTGVIVYLMLYQGAWLGLPKA